MLRLFNTTMKNLKHLLEAHTSKQLKVAFNAIGLDFHEDEVDDYMLPNGYIDPDILPGWLEMKGGWPELLKLDRFEGTIDIGTNAKLSNFKNFPSDYVRSIYVKADTFTNCRGCPAYVDTMSISTNAPFTLTGLKHVNSLTIVLCAKPVDFNDVQQVDDLTVTESNTSLSGLKSLKKLCYGPTDDIPVGWGLDRSFRFKSGALS